jgi:hypothetical protein
MSDRDSRLIAVFKLVFELARCSFKLIPSRYKETLEYKEIARSRFLHVTLRIILTVIADDIDKFMLGNMSTRACKFTILHTY